VTSQDLIAASRQKPEGLSVGAAAYVAEGGLSETV
jgi:hypothetical protein